MSKSEITIDQVQSAFAAAKNLNAALKNFLKREVPAGDPAVRFIKDFRTVVGNGRAEAIKIFIERNYKSHEAHFLALVKYAHSEVFGGIMNSIFEAHAEEFNKTYEKNDSGVVIKDKTKFSKIAKEVGVMAEAGLKAAALPTTAFLKSALLGCVFDPDVLKEVEAL